MVVDGGGGRWQVDDGVVGGVQVVCGWCVGGVWVIMGGAGRC